MAETEQKVDNRPSEEGRGGGRGAPEADVLMNAAGPPRGDRRSDDRRGDERRGDERRATSVPKALLRSTLRS